MKQVTIVFILSLSLTACHKPIEQTERSLTNTVFKLGRRTDSTSTGPLNSSAFIMKVNADLPALLLTAHHVAAGIAGDQNLKWNELEKESNVWAWNMSDTAYNFKVGRSLPIPGAETLKLDLAAYYMLEDNISYLEPASKAANVGDTVYLYSNVTFQNNTTLRNPAVVIYATDSVMVYELTEMTGNVAGVLSGTSGSCVLDKENNVVANSYAGLAVPNEEIKKQMAMDFPLINELNMRYGKPYGIGIPVPLIEKSLVHALKK